MHLNGHCLAVRLRTEDADFKDGLDSMASSSLPHYVHIPYCICDNFNTNRDLWHLRRSPAPGQVYGSKLGGTVSKPHSKMIICLEVQQGTTLQRKLIVNSLQYARHGVRFFITTDIFDLHNLHDSNYVTLGPGEEVCTC